MAQMLSEAETFLANMNTLMTGFDGSVDAAAIVLTVKIPPREIDDYVRENVGEHVGRTLLKGFWEDLGTAISGGAGIGSTIQTTAKRTYTVGTNTHNRTLLMRNWQALEVRRLVARLEDYERAFFLSMASLHATGKLSREDWAYHYTMTAWGGQQANIVPIEGAEQHKHIHEAIKHLQTLISTHSPYDTYVQKTSRFLEGEAKQPDAPAQIRETLNPGATLLEEEDLQTSRVFKPYDPRDTRQLFLGFIDDTTTPVGFDQSTTLITIGGAGTGKTMRHIVPNLLTYPGSCVILDPQGELWNDTAGYRSENIGPCYRFSPGAEGGSHNYNVLDAIGNPESAIVTEREEAHKVATGTYVLAKQLLPDIAGDRDPHWRLAGRNAAWSMLTSIALAEHRSGDRRNLRTLNDYLTYTSPERLAPLIEGAQMLANQFGLPDIHAYLDQLADMSPGQRGNIMGNAHETVSELTQTDHLRKPLCGHSHWHPQDLRNKPGTSVYISMPVAMMETWAPMLRMLLTQHVEILAAKRDESGNPPITFFMDEMPRLGHCQPLLDIQDIGRKANLRLWMVAQYYQQFKEHYKERASGIITSAALRMFIQPGNDEAAFINPNLGETENPFTGKSNPLIRKWKMFGDQYEDKIVAIARGQKPAILTAALADQDPFTLERMKVPPPPIPQ